MDPYKLEQIHQLNKRKQDMYNEVLDKFLEVSRIKLTDSPFGAHDFEVGTWMTADGYDVHVITEDPRNLNWETDVYYYKPDFDTIMGEILNIMTSSDEYVTVYCDDIDEYFDEYYILDYLQSNMDEDEWEEWSNANLEKDED